MSQRKFLRFAPIALFLLMLAALFYRASLSVEMSDEVFGIAGVLNALEGKKPFVTSWDTHTGWCLIAPFYCIYIALHGGSREGIVLFSRFLSLVVCLFLLYAGTRLYQNNRNRFSSSLSTPLQVICVLSVVVYIPCSIFQLSYNTLSAYLLFILLVIFQNPRIKSGGTYLAAGLIAGMLCITYPTMAVLAVALFCFIWRTEGKKHALKYGLSLSLVGLLFLTWILWDNSPSLIAEGLRAMFTSPHQISRGPINLHFLYLIFIRNSVGYLVRNFWMLPYIVFQIAMIRRKRVSKKRHMMSLNAFILISFCSTFVICMQGFHGPYWEKYCAVSAYLSVLLWILGDPALDFKEYGIYFAGILGYSLVYVFSSDNRNFSLGFHICAFITAFVSMIAFYDFAEKMKTETRLKWLADAAPLLALLLFSMPGLILEYQYIYAQEAPLFELTTKVESGTFKGVRTNQDTADFVVDFEQEVSEHIDDEKNMCVVTLEPMLYVMSKAEIYAPQTWDAQFLYRGFTSAEPLLDYFEAMGGDLPDILAATDRYTSDFSENTQYEIVPWIREHYHLYYEKNIDGITLWLWERNENQH